MILLVSLSEWGSAKEVRSGLPHAREAGGTTLSDPQNPRRGETWQVRTIFSIKMIHQFPMCIFDLLFTVFSTIEWSLTCVRFCRANEEIAQVRAKANAESVALNASLRKEQMKVDSLERALEQKVNSHTFTVTHMYLTHSVTSNQDVTINFFPRKPYLKVMLLFPESRDWRAH